MHFLNEAENIIGAKDFGEVLNRCGDKFNQ